MSEQNGKGYLMDVNEVMENLPHRYPFLWWTASLRWSRESASSA